MTALLRRLSAALSVFSAHVVATLTAVALTVAILTVAILAAATPSPAAAQGLGPSAGSAAPSVPEVDVSSPETIRAAVAQLSDAEVRKLLLERLDAVAESEPAPPTLAMGIEQLAVEGAKGFIAATKTALASVPNIPDGLADGWQRFFDERGIGGTLHLLGVLALAIGAGVALEWIVGNWGRRFTARLAEAEPTGPGEAIRLLATRFGLELVRLALFMGAAWIVISEAHPPGEMSYLILWFFLKQVLFPARAAAAVSRFLLAPRYSRVRLVFLDDQAAAFLHRNIVITATLLGLSWYIRSFLGGHGVDLGAIRLGYWLSLGVALWPIVAIYRIHPELSRLLTGEQPEISTRARRVAEAYPWYAMTVIALVWVIGQIFVGVERWDLLDGRLPLTMTILIAAPILDTAIIWAVRNFGPVMLGEGEIAERAHRAASAAYVRIGRVLAASVIVVFLADIWEFSFQAIANQNLGASLAGHLLEGFGVIAVGYVVWEVFTLWINRKLAEEKAAAAAETGDDEQGGEGGGPGGSRLSTVLPLVSWSVQAAIVTLTVLVALGSLGIDTTPLLAGAGIVGLAIGFGAQKLVADIVSGLFFLIDDAFRIGEYIEVEGTYGTVEKISLRSFQLPHQNGPVHTLPFGEIRRLTNYSRDWVIMKLKFTVPFDTDLKLVKRLFKQIGKEMDAMEQFAGDFLQPFKLQGVYEVDDVGIVIRGKFMSVPGRQWVLRKEVYARVQEAFDAHGIQFARKEVRVRIEGAGAEEKLSDADRHAIGAAAAEAAEPPSSLEPAPADGPGA